MKEIIETATPLNISADTFSRTEAGTDPADNDKTGAGVYLHNQSAGPEERWIPAVIVCSRYGLTLDQLRTFIKARNIEEPWTRDLQAFREYTPISAAQIRVLEQAWKVPK